MLHPFPPMVQAGTFLTKRREFLPLASRHSMSMFFSLGNSESFHWTCKSVVKFDFNVVNNCGVHPLFLPLLCLSVVPGHISGGWWIPTTTNHGINIEQGTVTLVHVSCSMLPLLPASMVNTNNESCHWSSYHGHGRLMLERFFLFLHFLICMTHVDRCMV